MSQPGSIIVTQGSLTKYNAAATAATATFKFAINPATLTRAFEFPLSAAGAPDPGAAPQETIRFVLHLDGSDQLEAAQPSPVYPNLAALEVLMQPPTQGEPAFLLFTWGARQIPVRITELKIMERLFDPALNPIQAIARVTLTVISGAQLPDFATTLGERYQQSIDAAAATVFRPPAAS